MPEIRIRLPGALPPAVAKDLSAKLCYLDPAISAAEVSPEGEVRMRS